MSEEPEEWLERFESEDLQKIVDEIAVTHRLTPEYAQFQEETAEMAAKMVNSIRHVERVQICSYLSQHAHSVWHNETRLEDLITNIYEGKYLEEN